MDGGHQATLDAPGVVQHLGDRGQAVGGARGVGDDGLAGVGLVVDAVHEHRGVVLAGRALDDLLGAGIDVLLAGVLGQEQAGGLDDDVGAHFVPLQFGGILDGGQADFLAVDDQGVAIYGDSPLEAAMHRVIHQHVGQIVGLKQVVDADDLDIGEILDGSAEYHAANAAKPVNTNFDSHSFPPVEWFFIETRAGVAAHPTRSSLPLID